MIKAFRFRALLGSTAALLPLLAPVAAASQDGWGPPSITPGRPITGTLSTGDDRLGNERYTDLYTFRGRAGQVITVTLQSRDFNAFVAVGNYGDFFVDNDNGPGMGNDAQLTVTLPVDGIYFISATSTNLNATGTYTLTMVEGRPTGGGQRPQPPPAPRLPPPAPIPSMPPSSRPGAEIPAEQLRTLQGEPVLAPGQTARGRLAPGDTQLNNGSYVDNYFIEGRRGQQITLTVRSRDFDAVVVLGDGVGFSELNDNAPGMGTDAQVRATLPADGVYAISIGGKGGTGAYTVSLETSGGATPAPARSPRPAPPPPAPPPPAPPASAAQGQSNLPTLVPDRPVAEYLTRNDMRLDSGAYGDTYLLNGRRGETVTVTLTSPLDAVVAIGDGGEFIRLSSDQPGNGTVARLTATLPADGTYIVGVMATTANTTGPYVISYTSSAPAAASNAPRPASPPPPPPPPSSNQPASGSIIQADRLPRVEGIPQLTVGQTASGRLQQGDEVLESGGPVDNYIFRGRRGQQITLTVRSREIDPIAVIANETGFSASNDDGPGMGTDSLIRATLPADGMYVIAISAIGGRMGAYTVSLDEAGGTSGRPAPAPARPAPTPSPSSSSQNPEAAVILAGRPEQGTLSTSDTRSDSGSYSDFFIYPGEAGERLTIRLTSTAFDPQLVIANGSTILSSNDNGPNMGRNAQIVVTLPAAGIYFIAVNSADGRLGAYTLSVTSSG